MSKIKAILFDLDGTLRDSREPIFLAIEHALKTHVGSTPSRQELLPHIHHHEEVQKVFAANTDPAKFLKSYWEKVEELRNTMVPYEGAHDLLSVLHKAGYRLGIVSTASTAVQYLESHGVSKLFDVIVGGKDTVEHKPSPVPVFRALELLNLDAKDAIMIGDLPADIASATSAGLRATVGITHGFGTATMLKDAGADYTIDSYDQLVKILKEFEK